MIDLMCSDYEAARRNRERAKNDPTDQFYDEQERAVYQWRLEGSKPKSVVVGELPLVNVRQIRLDRD